MPSSAMEYDLAKAGMHMLIEKPISMRPEEEVGRLGKVGLCLVKPPWELDSLSHGTRIGRFHTYCEMQ